MGKSLHIRSLNDNNDKRKRRKSRRLLLEDFESVMHLRQQDAAKKLDVCLSSFKRCFASLNLKWPTPKQRKFLRHHREIQCRLWSICNELGEITDDTKPKEYFEFSKYGGAIRKKYEDNTRTEYIESASHHNYFTFEKLDIKKTILNNKMRPLYSQNSPASEDGEDTPEEDASALKEEEECESPQESWSLYYKKFLRAKELLISEACNIKNIYNNISQLSMSEPHNRQIQEALRTINEFSSKSFNDITNNNC